MTDPMPRWALALCLVALSVLLANLARIPAPPEHPPLPTLPTPYRTTQRLP